MADVNAVLAAAQNLSGAAGQQAIDLRNIMDQESALLQEQASLTNSVGGKTIGMLQQEALSALQAQERTQAMATAFGISPEYTADIQVQLANEFRQSTLAAMDAQNKFAEKQSIGFFDSPLDYIMNQLTYESDKNAVDALKNKAAMASQALSSIDSNMSTAANTANLIQTKLTEATIQDQLKAAAGEIRKQQIQYLLKDTGNKAQTIQQIYALNRDQLSAAQAAYSAMASEESRQMQREQMQYVREERAARLADKQTQDQYYVDAAALIQAAEKDRYGRVITTPEQVKAYLGKAGVVGDNLRSLYDHGYKLAAGMPSVYGDSPLEVAKTLSTQAINVDDAQAPFAKLIVNAVGEAQKVAKKPEELNAVADDMIKKQVMRWQAKVDPADQNNPFSAPALAAYDAKPEIAKNPAWKLLRAAKQNAKAPYNPDEALSIMAEGVAQGNIKIEDAVSAVTLAGSLTIELNNKLKNPAKFTGIPQTVYMAPVKYQTAVQRGLSYASAAGPAITAAGVATGVGAVPAFVAGGAISGLGYLAGKSKDHIVNQTDPAAIRAAILQKIPTVLNTQGLYPEGWQGFYPPMTIKGQGIDTGAKQ